MTVYNNDSTKRTRGTMAEDTKDQADGYYGEAEAQDDELDLSFLDDETKEDE